MQLSELRERVQPSLLQDFDAVYEEFLLEVGHGRLRPFVEQLATFELIPGELRDQLLEVVPDREPSQPAPPPEVPAEVAEAQPAPSPVEEAPEGARSEVAAPEPEPPTVTPPPAPPPVPEFLTRTTVTPVTPTRELLPPALVRPEPVPEGSRPLSARETIPADDLDDGRIPLSMRATIPAEDATVRLPTRDQLLAAEEAQASAVAETAQRPRPDLKRPSMVKTVELPLAEALELAKSQGVDLSARTLELPVDDDEWEEPPADDDAGPKRTMFRKLTGGEIRETGRFGDDKPEPAKRRRRRRLPKTEGPYRFEGTVGEGAMGRVLLARDARLHRPVAYKAMSEELLEQPALASKFGAEVQITAQLDHPNIVPVYTLESATAYTMKLIEGRTLEHLLEEVREHVKKGRAIPDALGLERRIDLFLRVCEAVSYAHSRGVIHRDLKPENIMVGQWGEVYVMDWGIAKVFDARVPKPVQVESQDEEDEGDLIIGTAGYMSPEQAEGWNDKLNASSDQYALGLILFELVCLRPAVTGKAPLKLVMRHQDGEKDPLVHLGGEPIAKELAAIVHKATAKSIKGRYTDVAQLAEDLRRYLRGEPVLARPDGPIGAIVRWMGKHRELTLSVVAAMLVGAGLLTVGVVGYSQIRVAQAQASEQRTTTLLTAAAKQTSSIDGQFLKIEGLLSVVSTAAADALLRTSDPGMRAYDAADFGDPSTAPPDAEPPTRGEKYGTQLVSTTTPVFVGGEPTSERRLRLADMGRHFQRVLLRSHSEKRAATNRSLARRTLLEVDIPVSWAFVALDDGTLESFPGHGGWPSDLSVLDSPWYQAAKDEQAPVWGRVTAHPVTGAQVLTVSQAMLDATDQTLGVAGLHLSLGKVRELLLPPSLVGTPDVRACLLDPAGLVVLCTDDTAGGSTYPHQPVLAALADARAGMTRDGDTLIVFNRMTSNGWSYALSGPEHAMLR